MKTLRPAQIEDLATLISNPKHMMLGEPSTGKTPVVCVNQRYRFSEFKEGTVWTMPKTLMGKNRDELLDWTDFKPSDVRICEKESDITPGPKVFIMTFERFRRSWHCLPDYVKSFDGDEFHKAPGLKNPKKSTFVQNLNKFMKKARGFVPMSGTIVNGRIESAFVPIHIIEPRYYGNFEAFCQYHVHYDLYGTRIGTKNEKKIESILKLHGCFHSFKEVHGDKKIVYFNEMVDMNPKQREMYDKFEKDALLELETFFVTGQMPGQAFIRARQIMEHPNSFPNLIGEGTVDICPGENSGKLDRTELHLTDASDLNKPLVCFAAFRPQQAELVKLSEGMKIRTGLINGDTSGKERWRIDKAFRAGDIQSMVVSPECADVGLNWQMWGSKEVDHIIFVSLTPLDTTFSQAYMRFIRGERVTTLRATVMQYKNSLDQRMVYLIEKKSKEAHRADSRREVINLSAA